VGSFRKWFITNQMSIEVYHRDRTINLVQRAQYGQYLKAKVHNAICLMLLIRECEQLYDHPRD